MVPPKRDRIVRRIEKPICDAAIQIFKMGIRSEHEGLIDFMAVIGMRMLEMTVAKGYKRETHLLSESWAGGLYWAIREGGAKCPKVDHALRTCIDRFKEYLAKDRIDDARHLVHSAIEICLAAVEQGYTRLLELFINMFLPELEAIIGSDFGKDAMDIINGYALRLEAAVKGERKSMKTGTYDDIEKEREYFNTMLKVGFRVFKMSIRVGQYQFIEFLAASGMKILERTVGKSYYQGTCRISASWAKVLWEVETEEKEGWAVNKEGQGQRPMVMRRVWEICIDRFREMLAENLIDDARHLVRSSFEIFLVAAEEGYTELLEVFVDMFVPELVSVMALGGDFREQAVDLIKEYGSEFEQEVRRQNWKQSLNLAIVGAMCLRGAIAKGVGPCIWDFVDIFEPVIRRFVSDHMESALSEAPSDKAVSLLEIFIDIMAALNKIENAPSGKPYNEIVSSLILGAIEAVQKLDHSRFLEEHVVKAVRQLQSSIHVYGPPVSKVNYIMEMFRGVNKNKCTPDTVLAEDIARRIGRLGPMC